MYAPGLSRRTRSFLLVFAQLAVIAYLFQIAAVDHWQAGHSHEILGIEGTSKHVLHCHGDLGSCSTMTSAGAALPQVAPLPAAPAPRVSELEAPLLVPAAIVPAVPVQPPQALL